MEIFETAPILTGSEVNEGVYTALLDAIDVIVKLDILKDSKSALINDFTRYKRMKAMCTQSLTPEEKV